MIETALLWGFVGGALRGVIGFLKHKFSYKEVTFSLGSFLSTVGISGLVGVAVSLVAKELGVSFFGSNVLTPALGVLVGYAGGDFLESAWKIVSKNATFYNQKSK